ncbi:hypothetical protein KL935_003846 [Ogataea polymorpha]|nr:hypothetical protein KL935_003846 [Ogataea polymorpha]KAG7907468.1 hypothetical protein KL906_004155 [Ogataea polymorpha]KAG7915040.1 hypothetical protein KL927_004029 [Ogataea polymorpha]
MAAENKLTWDSLPYELLPWLREALVSNGYESMTPVQASVIPLFSGNKDVVVQAVTGSGKTLAFVIPVLEKICHFLREESTFKRGHFGALIICPTKELAFQIEGVINNLVEFCPDDSYKLKAQAVLGGVGTVLTDVQNFMKTRAQVIIATPGRVVEFLQHSMVKTSSCQVLILDEADRLLDHNFSSEMSLIAKILPRQKRVGMFSATMSAVIDDVFKLGMSNPVRITVKSDQLSKKLIPSKLRLFYSIVPADQKIGLLFHLLESYQFKRAIVYFPTCVCVSYFYMLLNHLLSCLYKQGNDCKGIRLHSLHGKLQLETRTKTLSLFSGLSDYKNVLLSTDVAARGLDIPDVDLVIQLDPPTDPDVFVHRCGRAGRAGKSGTAVVFLTPGLEENYVDFMSLRKVELHDLGNVHYDPQRFELIHQESRTWLLADRARHEKATKAFVTYIRHYSKHSAASIFRLSALDYWGLAKEFSLFRFPKMPENKFIHDFPEGGFIDKSVTFESQSYSNAQNENERLQEFCLSSKTVQPNDAILDRKARKERNSPWSKNAKSKVNEKQSSYSSKENKKKRLLLPEAELRETQEDWKDLVRSNKRQKARETTNFFNDL